MSELWSEIVDGTAVGPTGYVAMHNGDAEVQALWDNERGVQITLHAPDFTMTLEEIVTLRSLVDELLAIPAPTRRAA